MGDTLKVLLLNGSPRMNGNITLALKEMEQVFAENGVEFETIRLGNKVIRGCVACDSCRKTGRCVFDDEVNVIAEKFREADGLVIASPVYYGSANGTLMSALQRLFYSTHFDKSLKVGASVVKHAGRHEPVLEQHLRLGAGRRKRGPRGPSGHAGSGEEHGISHEEHCLREEGNRPSRGRAEGLDQFHEIRRAGTYPVSGTKRHRVRTCLF